MSPNGLCDNFLSFHVVTSIISLNILTHKRGEHFIRNDLEHKLYVGFGGFIIPVPPALSGMGANKSVKDTIKNASLLSAEERKVHHFIVRKMADVKYPITADLIANDLGMCNNRVHEIIDKLESLKTFIYRSDGKGINWAYPLSLENTGFRMTASSGEQFWAA